MEFRGLMEKWNDVYLYLCDSQTFRHDCQTGDRDLAETRFQGESQKFSGISSIIRHIFEYLEERAQHCS